MTARSVRPDEPSAPVKAGRGRFDGRALPRAAAADPRWLKLGIAAALGLAAGAMLFPTEAKGREEGRDEGPAEGRGRGLSRPRRASAPARRG